MQSVYVSTLHFVTFILNANALQSGFVVGIIAKPLIMRKC